MEVLCKTVHLSSDVDLEEIASLTDDFTGADLRGLLTSAQIKTLDLLQDDGRFLKKLIIFLLIYGSFHIKLILLLNILIFQILFLLKKIYPIRYSSLNTFMLVYVVLLSV